MNGRMLLLPPPSLISTYSVRNKRSSGHPRWPEFLPDDHIYRWLTKKCPMLIKLKWLTFRADDQHFKLGHPADNHADDLPYFERWLWINKPLSMPLKTILRRSPSWFFMIFVIKIYKKSILSTHNLNHIGLGLIIFIKIRFGFFNPPNL